MHQNYQITQKRKTMKKIMILNNLVIIGMMLPTILSSQKNDFAIRTLYSVSYNNDQKISPVARGFITRSLNDNFVVKFDFITRTTSAKTRLTAAYIGHENINVGFGVFRSAFQDRAFWGIVPTLRLKVKNHTFRTVVELSYNEIWRLIAYKYRLKDFMLGVESRGSAGWGPRLGYILGKHSLSIVPSYNWGKETWRVNVLWGWKY